MKNGSEKWGARFEELDSAPLDQNTSLSQENLLKAANFFYTGQPVKLQRAVESITLEQTAADVERRLRGLLASGAASKLRDGATLDLPFKWQKIQGTLDDAIEKYKAEHERFSQNYSEYTHCNPQKFSNLVEVVLMWGQVKLIKIQFICFNFQLASRNSLEILRLELTLQLSNQ